MDIQIKNYTFDASLKTITFDDYVTIRLDSVRVITNVTDNILIYNFVQKGRGGTVLTNVLTLEYDVTSMDDADDLQIVYNDEYIKATQSDQQALLTELQLKADLTETQPISAASLPLPTGASTEAKQLPDGHNVTANAGTNLNTSGLATEATLTADLQAIEDNQTDGSQKSQSVHSDGTLGQLISGVQYVSGKSGIDSSTNSLQTITYEHHEIHSGSAYTLSYLADLANGGVADILIVTPDTTKYAHFVYDVTVESEANVKFYENVTATAGTAIPIYNRRRISGNTPAVTVTHTPTGITTGTTIIRERQIGTGKSSGGQDRGSHEFILLPNTKYLFRVTNTVTTANQISIQMDWYEHTDKTIDATTTTTTVWTNLQKK